jgi:very-short-patch-repair endonuclease
MKDKLISLKDRLNDLSRRNRSIRMLKLYDKWSFDLYNLKKIEKDPVSLLDAVVKLTVNQTLVKQDIDNDESLVLSKRLTNLYRNLKSIEEETGLYDLFVGYPFVSGTMRDGTYVRAPLFLYPVRLERDKSLGTSWRLSANKEAEPQLNRTLFLAMKKLNEVNLPEEIFEKVEGLASNHDYKAWLNGLKAYSLNISMNVQEELLPFKDYKKETIPVLKKGDFQLERMAVLGHFPQGNSALLKDYEDFISMIEEGETGLGLAEELLKVGEFSDEEDQFVDNLEAAQVSTKQEKSEKERFLVLDTDASQEEIIDSIDDHDGLVVHGPPGTGKSQVIVNIIANAIAQNQKVLLVCQKRAALDVVYQRLDSLGLTSSVGLLHDEKNDRKGLYRKLYTRLTTGANYQDLEEEFNELSSEIEQTENELNRIAKGLYEVQPHGYRAFDLYSIGKPLTNQEVTLDLSAILPELNKRNLEDVTSKVFTYGDYYSHYGSEDYPLKHRKSFAKLEIKDHLNLVEILKRAITEAEQSAEYLEHFDQEGITPAYSWLVNEKLEKIFDDLNPDEKKTLKKLRLWWWTSFTGKTIVDELLNGEKFKGLSSTEWPKLRESLRLLYDLSQISGKMSKDIKALETYFTKKEIDGLHKSIEKGDIPLNDLAKQQEYVIRDFEGLRNMDRIYEESLPFMRSIIDALKDKSNDLSKDELPKKWAEIVAQSAYVHWIDEIERKHPDLLKVGTEAFDNLRKKFRKLLQKKKELSAKVLQNRLLYTLLEKTRENTKAIKEIEHQTGKKRQIWPVRKLVQQFALKGLIDVTPVWLVSPETASAIFPLEKDLFDVVIFDEASQCTVENGIPAIYRGKKTIIAGDEKQLPPSSLFKGSLQGDEEEDEVSDLEESESLLNLAKRVFPSKMLQWHYRSKSEELINFSNHAYYNGNIQIAPNVAHLKEPSSLQWHKVDGRWINQCNEVEAHAVVDLLKVLLVKDANKSIGIITFNAKQQDKIQDIIDQKTEDDEEFNTLYQQVMGRELDERIFVKNIENVQGDERDIILFSIAYAKNQEGRVYNRFGTLGQQGGENRLNVAVTRAKEEIHVVSSIEPHELNVSSTKNDGPKFLRSYMEYAQAVSRLQKETVEAVLTSLNAEMNTKQHTGESLVFDSPFEEQVYEHLTNLGYKVDTQVGMSGYRIDQAIVHPLYPEQYILGIECDGAMYHSAPSAKERDVYRQRFLESKGWTIARIWSRNWWRDPSAEIEKIDHLVKQLVKEAEAKEAIRQ